MNNLIGHCVEHAYYPPNVAHVITSRRLIFSLVHPKDCIARWITTDMTRRIVSCVSVNTAFDLLEVDEQSTNMFAVVSVVLTLSSSNSHTKGHYRTHF